MAAYKENPSFNAKCAQLKDMIWELQCYSCESVPSPFKNGMNRYPCNNEQHLLCENCNEKCKCGSSVNTNPSKFVNQIYEDFPWYCGYFPNGCREILPKEQLGSHEKNCLYKPVYCPRISCSLKIPFIQFTTEHETKCIGAAKMMGENESDLWKIKMATTTILKPNNVMQLILRSGKVFYLNVQRKPEASMIWVQFHGSDDELSNYEYSVTSSHSDEKKQFSFSAPVLPLTEKPETIPDNNYVFTIKAKIAQKYASSDELIRLAVRIRCLKDVEKYKDVESD